MNLNYFESKFLLSIIITSLSKIDFLFEMRKVRVFFMKESPF
jgi:hypothetical protein